MKLPVAAVVAALIACASSASAADCTAAQLASLQLVDDDNKAFETACPALFQDGSEVLDPTDAKTFSKDALEALAPCKAATCTTYLTQLTDKTPDCSVIGINVKGLYGAVLKLCTKFAAGTVSEEELEQIFKDVIGTSPLLEIGSDNSNSTGNSTKTTAPAMTTRSPAQPAESCCAKCLGQSDPKAGSITYDPLVYVQCNAARGVCCYGCMFTHGSPAYLSGVTFDGDDTAQTTAGTSVRFTFDGVSRITYDFLAGNQAKKTFVGNESTSVMPASDGTFTLCARAAGVLSFRGWGADSCSQVTTEYNITVAAGTATCAIATELVESSGAGETETVGGNATITAPTSAPSKDTAATTAPAATTSSAVNFFTGAAAIATAAAVSVMTL